MLSAILNFGLVNFMRCEHGIIVNVRKYFYLQEIDAEIFRGRYVTSVICFPNY